MFQSIVQYFQEAKWKRDSDKALTKWWISRTLLNDAIKSNNVLEVEKGIQNQAHHYFRLAFPKFIRPRKSPPGHGGIRCNDEDYCVDPPNSFNSLLVAIEAHNIWAMTTLIEDPLFRFCPPEFFSILESRIVGCDANFVDQNIVWIVLSSAQEQRVSCQDVWCADRRPVNCPNQEWKRFCTTPSSRKQWQHVAANVL